MKAKQATDTALTRRIFLQRAASATLGAGVFLPAISGSSATRSAGELLSEAEQRIERHRKADGVIVVRDKRGSAVRGARIRVEQVRHEFLFGCNFFMFDKCGDAESEERYRQQFAALFNYATLGFYWSGFEPEPGRPNYTPNERAAAWCAERLITCKGHPLVWDHEGSSPKWLPNILLAVGEAASDRVTDVVSHYRGKIDVWDVVNEPTHIANANFKAEASTHMAQYAASIGPRAYTAEYLNVARAANPNATLLVNDYRTDFAYYLILDSLRKNDRLLFDAVGIQSHMHGERLQLPKLWEICETYAGLGKPVHFTETTIPSSSRIQRGAGFEPTKPEMEAAQQKYVADYYTLLFSHPAVEAITWWDFSDRGAWQGAAAGFLRRDMTPKPVYDRLKQLIKGQWWTKADGVADPNGRMILRAFAGLYKVTVERDGFAPVSRVVPWRRGIVNCCEITV